MDKNKTVYKAFSTVISSELEKFKNEQLTRHVAMSIYVSIFNKIYEIVKTANLVISEDCVNWIAQAYYSSIKINGRYELPRDIFTKKVAIQDLNNGDMLNLILVFKESNTQIEDEVYIEHKRRTTASLAKA